MHHMQEAEEQDTCRICSAPAEPDQPLFYPCKCSGTIRYIHQDCLTTWLAHSKKKHCDVCKHPYSFTKVYAPGTPARLPPVLLIRRLAQQSLFALLFGIRAIAVAIIWLAVLPWVTVWTWRMYFSMGDSTAWWISDRPRPPSTSPTLHDYLLSTVANRASIPLLTRVTSHPLWLALSADIFTGQIIASLIVLTFVAVFLLREWISQNARPGVFEDEDIPAPEERERPAQAEPQPIPEPAAPALPPRMPLVDHLAEGQGDADAGKDAGALDDHPIVDRPLHGKRPLRHRAIHPAKHTTPISPKGKERAMGNAFQSDLRVPARARRRLHSGSRTDRTNITGHIPDFEGLRKRAFSRRLHAARLSGLEHRVDAASNTSSHEGELHTNEPGNFEFTFRATARLPRRSHPEPRSQTESSRAPPTHFPIVQLEPPVEPIPFGLVAAEKPIPQQDCVTPLSPTPEEVLPVYSLAPTGGNNESGSSFPPLPSIHRRPPLSATTLPAAQETVLPTAPLIPLSSRSNTASPLASPSLSTHRVPEGFEAGPSIHKSYFDSEDSSLEDEHQEYFRERSIDDEDPNDDGTDDGDDDDVSVSENSNAGKRKLYLLDSEEETEEDSESEEDSEEGLEVEDEDTADFEILEGVGWEPETGRGENQAPTVGAGAVEPAQPQQHVGEPAPPAPALAPEGNDELDVNVEDDMEGAMEAIGMRGPIYGVVQNAALMIFVLDTAIGLGVWIPFTIGKSTALLSLDPYRFLQLLHFPIRAMRIITDPVVDSVVLLIIQFVLPILLGIIRRLINITFFSGMFILSKVFGQEEVDKRSQTLVEAYSSLERLLRNPREISWRLSSDHQPASDISILSWIRDFSMPLVALMEPHFAILGEKLRDSATRLQVTWKRMALGQGPGERVFAVALGYAVVGMLLSLYLNILTVSNVKSAGRAVRSAIRQQLLVIKVATFIFIELVTFPLGCGVVLDLCTVWLFPEANLLTRVAYFMYAPLTAMFYHWVAGTMFMYSFAVLLAGCRSVMRPGAMWFIKDPQDQNSHPIRDILDRPTLVQLRKIFISGMMYSFVVACVVGSVSGLLLLGNRSIMPIRWRTREPLSNVPVDLLFLHQVLPYTMHYFRPKKVLKKVSTVIWKFLARRLRLSSYFFGGRYPSEECAPEHWIWSTIVGSSKQADDRLAHVREGSFRRVPNTDHIALPRDMRATAAVHENGEPMDEAASLLMKAQDLETEKAKRVVKDDYTVVYIPPHFRYRILLFILLLWGVGAVFVGFFVGAPLQLGRRLFKLFIVEDVHDGYSFIVGFYVLWGCYIVGKSVGKLDKRRQRRVWVGPRADLPVYAVKCGLIWLAKISYMIFFFGGIIPILVAFMVDLYIVLPIRFIVDPHMMPRIRVADMWALGILYSNMAVHFYQLQPGNRLTVGLQNVISNGWTHPDPVAATREVIGPATLGLTGMILFPAAIFLAVRRLLPWLPIDNKFIFVHVYPGIFALAGFFRATLVMFRLLSSWSQSIRDKEFLVEMRLRNLEPERDGQSLPDITTIKDMETEYSTDN